MPRCAGWGKTVFQEPNVIKKLLMTQSIGFDKFFFDFFQVVIVGNGAVGKSSMIQRYCKGNFTQNYNKTIGVDFLEKHIT